MRNEATRGTFALNDLPTDAKVEVLGEGRQVQLVNRSFADEFKPYEVHLYRFSQP